jgi:hypothetical protein
MPEQKSYYRVSGTVGYTDDYYDQPATWVGQELDQVIEAVDDQEAVEKGRQIVNSFVEQHKELHPDNHINALDQYPKLHFTITRIHVLFEMEWKKGREGQPAQPAVEEIKPHVEEKIAV